MYDYKCDGCGHRFERNQRMADPPITVCPECNAEKVRKVLTTGGVMIGGTSRGAASAPSPCAGGMCGTGMCGLN
jgi:putative FmdB family regulatory protein